MKKTIEIDSETIDLWFCRPDKINAPHLLSQYRAILPTIEKEKVDRYKFARHRHDALITRAFLREILSTYSHYSSDKWDFDTEENGKPFIRTPKINLKFNVSHTQGCIICAITQYDAIGCDVENCLRNNEVLEIATRYFANRELEQINLLPDNEKVSRFFDFWTLKESFIKTTGKGLATPLKSFHFNINNENQPLNTAISLVIDADQEENSDFFKSLLFYYNDEHRVALTVKNTNKNKLRLFETRPFESYSLMDSYELRF